MSDWLTSRLTDWLTDRPTDCLIVCLMYAWVAGQPASHYKFVLFVCFFFYFTTGTQLSKLKADYSKTILLRFPCPCQYAPLIFPMSQVLSLNRKTIKKTEWLTNKLKLTWSCVSYLPYLFLQALVTQLHQVERQIQANENSLREEKEKRRKYYVCINSLWIFTIALC